MRTASLGAVVGCVRGLAARDTHGLSDRQLLDRFCLDRDGAAFAELVRRHGPLVLAVCRRVLRHEQDAEDAFQAAFLVLARRAGSIRQGDAVGGWLHQVAHRLAVRARLVADRRRDRFTALGDEPPAPAPTADLHAALDEELARLPDHYRAAVVLCYLEGRSQAEAARLLATTAEAVNSRLKRARDLLRRRLSRHGLAVGAAALTAALTARAAGAALPPALARRAAEAACRFAAGSASCGASPLAADLAKGALDAMAPAKIKLVLSSLVAAAALLTAAALAVPAPTPGEGRPERGAAPRHHTAPEPVGATVADGEARPQRACIIVWLGGGPSQIDTFDPKPGQATGGPFKAIKTTAPGVEVTELLPQLAKRANHLAIIRSVTHHRGDHAGSTYLMRTGFEPDEAVDYPSLGCVLAKELGEKVTGLPRYVSVNSGGRVGFGPGFLGARYAPLRLGPIPRGEGPPLPPAEAFEALEKGQGEAMRKGVTKAFDLGQEKAELRDAYGRGAFGQGCLLARRLVEAGVPVVEVGLGGWDTHANLAGALPPLCKELDAGLATLLKDLHDRKRLGSTLVVCMGEFGRTPNINQQLGRDHWPRGFSVVLAGGDVKGGQAVGKTSADGSVIDARPVTPAELLATVYQAVGIDPAKENRTGDGKTVPLVGQGTKAVKEALDRRGS
jgi:RNA polymerase sigma factor (sigma-70 family)